MQLPQTYPCGAAVRQVQGHSLLLQGLPGVLIPPLALSRPLAQETADGMHASDTLTAGERACTGCQGARTHFRSAQLLVCFSLRVRIWKCMLHFPFHSYTHTLPRLTYALRCRGY